MFMHCVQNIYFVAQYYIFNNLLLLNKYIIFKNVKKKENGRFLSPSKEKQGRTEWGFPKQH